MKVYPTVDLTGDKYLNPDGYIWNDNEGSHQRSVGQIRSISIHHDAALRPHDYDSVGRYHTEAAEHYLRLGFGFQYNFKIDNTGTIYAIRPLTTWLNCVGTSENVSTLAICLDGNFETQEPTREQYEALYQLLQGLCEQHPEFPATWPNVRSHSDYVATACCGANLRDKIFAINSNADAQAQLLGQGMFDWPSLQPGYVPEAPPSVPTPPVVNVPPVIPVPEPHLTPGMGNGQVTADLPIKVVPTVPEYVTTYKAFEQLEELTVQHDTQAVDLTGVGAPLTIKAGSSTKVAGDLTFNGEDYYRGANAAANKTWYAVPVEAYQLDHNLLLSLIATTLRWLSSLFKKSK